MKDEKITSLLTSEDVIDPYVSFIWQWGDTLLAISKTGLYEYRNKEFYPLKLFDPPVHFSRAVLLDEKVLFSVKNKLMVINRKSEINEISNSNWLTKKVINKIQLVDDRLFCSTYQGAYEISIEDDSLHLIKAFNKDLEVTSIMKDHESNYWCSTLGDGLLKFSNLDYELLNNKDTYGILVKDNTIYTGMGSTEYLIYENGTINYGKLQPKNSFVNQKIRDLKFLNGALWFEVDGGIARVEKGQTYYYRTGVGEIVEYMGKPVIGNKTGCYILDSWKQFDELHPNVKPRKLMYDLVKPIISKRIFSLEVVQEDLWVGTRKGLVIVHDNKKDRELFKDLHVKQIVSHKNEVVVAFESSPVILINGSDTTDLSATYHLPESGYNDIFFNSNYFLFSSATGLFQINRNSGEVITTLNNVNIKETEIYHDSLYISSENGLYRSKFPLENITKYSIPVELVSTQVNLKHVGNEIPVKLSYDENNLSMEFRAISYSEYPLSYYYQLNDQEWEPFEGKLTLKALTDGNYGCTR